MDLSTIMLAWISICLFMRKLWNYCLLWLCLLVPELLLFMFEYYYSDNFYDASVKEDCDMDTYITLFFYLFPHNCNELTKYIKFIYKWHPFYKWHSHEFTICLKTTDEKQLIFNPFNKVNIVTGEKLLFGLIE